MDMKKMIKRSIDVETTNGAPEDDNEDEGGGKRNGERKLTKPAGSVLMLVSCMIFFLVLVLLFRSNQQGFSLEWLSDGLTTKPALSGHNDVSISSLPEPPKDWLLGGPLTNVFDRKSCLSRYQSGLYWKATSHIPSPHLLQRLRDYEALHKKCGPGTELFRHSIEQLKSNRSTGPLECSYVVWLPSDGLGNRIITIVSAFLYALLNNKVLLLSFPDDLRDIFCEPFPQTSWVLPSDDFPVENYENFDKNTRQSYGNMLGDKVLFTDMHMSAAAANVSLPAYAYLHLRHDYSELDKHFFCEESQLLLRKFRWLLLRSNVYFVPALFLISEYENELNLLFPQKETVFHHLSRYLLHPSNSVWEQITRYYEAYLANANERLGLQIRIFPYKPVTFEEILAKVINCTLEERLLPNISTLEEPLRSTTSDRGRKRKAVLVTTLKEGYFEKLRNMYYEHPTTTGEIISVHQPSHEGEQRTEQKNHNVKALSEIYLLSFSDALVTSAWSTFGYVAQGLGGLKPWILLTLDNDKSQPACRRAMSMEPCFHAPQDYDCKARRYVDKGAVIRHIKHCEDVHHGIKLVD